tara:strand:- start:191 stop:382 length:192 start_codon:yes stop_codon:yes gene_type:complete
MKSELTIEDLRDSAQKYFTEVIKILKETPEDSAEYESHVKDLEAMSSQMSEESYEYLKLKVIY